MCVCVKKKRQQQNVYGENNKQNRQHSHGMTDGIAYWIRVDRFLVATAHSGRCSRCVPDFACLSSHVCISLHTFRNGRRRKINKPLVYKVSNVWSINIISMKISIWKPNINLYRGENGFCNEASTQLRHWPTTGCARRPTDWIRLAVIYTNRIFFRERNKANANARERSLE